MLAITQSAVNPQFLEIEGLFRDYTPSFICYSKLNNILSHNYKLLLKHHGIHIRQFSTTSNNNLSNKDKFAYYLSGLIEGDGTIIVPKTERTKGRLNYPSIQIVFNLKDLPLALVIQKELKHGSLSRKKGVNAYVLTINNKEGILLLINLINGKMKTPKIYSLYKLID
jgi:LAGLIDADG DNA endonuclease family protein